MPKYSIASEVFRGIAPHLEGRHFEPHEAAKLVALISAKLRERTHGPPIQAEPSRESALEIKNGRYYSKGTPISDFTLGLVKSVNEAGIRIIRFRHSHVPAPVGVQEVVATSPENLESNQAFRSFCFSLGPFHWQGGQRDLNELVRMIDTQGYTDQAEHSAPPTPEQNLQLQNLATQLKIHHERLTVLERSLSSNKSTDH